MTDSEHGAILRGLIWRLQAIAAQPPEQAITTLGELVDLERPDAASRVLFEARRAAARAAKRSAGSGVRLARQLGISEEVVSRLTREVRRSDRS